MQASDNNIKFYLLYLSMYLCFIAAYIYLMLLWIWNYSLKINFYVRFKSISSDLETYRIVNLTGYCFLYICIYTITFVNIIFSFFSFYLLLITNIAQVFLVIMILYKSLPVLNTFPSVLYFLYLYYLWMK